MVDSDRMGGVVAAEKKKIQKPKKKKFDSDVDTRSRKRSGQGKGVVTRTQNKTGFEREGDERGHVWILFAIWRIRVWRAQCQVDSERGWLRLL